MVPIDQISVVWLRNGRATGPLELCRLLPK